MSIQIPPSHNFSHDGRIHLGATVKYCGSLPKYHGMIFVVRHISEDDLLVLERYDDAPAYWWMRGENQNLVLRQDLKLMDRLTHCRKKSVELYPCTVILD